ncbi:MAG: hypothetical protein A2391_00925 [Candidatus Brennerbacteria bacterium RIFOXYB1_FULL_41_13]|uniref:2'-5' RNA ligase n=1 Tax=Candidatus Brennerbacteria bacterium RIFOXYD1_FULL_41_16 TaxID=1797529 RepID=A0A1G1XKW9_9BACT|nr:MAG: hypothetical protein A2391_00925 [Candidatus Brennerbacteria bacterium RIFOXYB1_FULL_41_13]OGY40544.1 MAG: hypothetical protein A2570_02275 [Candidatus Brennerbacteria bacterium RIFOXYD1_FULL_41_16]
MAYLVVAYPKISEFDFNWIQEYRSKNDPRYFNVVKPHFTIVFATGDISQEEFIQEAKKQTENIQQFDFELNIATINQDDSKEYYHEFLVPEKGYAAIVKLHDKLYSGAFYKNLRFDIDFIPHVGIGNADDVQESKKRVDSLNAKSVSIIGKVDTLDILEYKDGKVSTIDQIKLLCQSPNTKNTPLSLQSA